ncbi:unnamed protein product (macronuclear) [Paramecium tetraurelia]|uniref:Uncharacterized protein n=1 Tax=Paramecium tetraurelia TaxID=5888 RepID=A0D4J9_PARTE|nr:uncharacterized protein GSPATT00013432001 [Paramecium tetraurelia]CAK77966.1 unnamed protein product [Paramecium tetraurelia]|eukprot:XP_001445363.1 hypothetical protein (macronuclear) [Paramecium tetraurelia strain d4-2]
MFFQFWDSGQHSSLVKEEENGLEQIRRTNSGKYEYEKQNRRKVVEKFKNKSDIFDLQDEFVAVAGYGITWSIEVKECRQTLVRMQMKKMMTSRMDHGGDESLDLFYKG